MAKNKHRRKKPGTTGEGRFYRIEVRPKDQFKTFRIQDVGKKGGLERLAGKRSSGSWDTVTWLVEKKDAHLNNSGQLVIDGIKARSVLRNIRGKITHIKGGVFKALPRKNIAEKDKPTLAQRRAQKRNIKKAQAGWRKK